MIAMRFSAILSCLVVAACSSASDGPAPPPRVRPSAPSPEAALAGAKVAVVEEKLVGLVEVSAVRPAVVGPGQYFLCLRGAQSPSGPRRTHAVFFNNDDYRGSRLSAINEACEAEAFRPLK